MIAAQATPVSGTEASTESVHVATPGSPGDDGGHVSHTARGSGDGAPGSKMEPLQVELPSTWSAAGAGEDGADSTPQMSLLAAQESAGLDVGRGGGRGTRGAGAGRHDARAKKAKQKPMFVLLALVVGAAFFFIPVFGDETGRPERARSRRCLALVMAVTVSWVTEAVPFFVTSMSVPPLSVLLGVLAAEKPVIGPPGCSWRNCTISHHEEGLAAPEAAHLALKSMFDPVMMLLLGGFGLTAALARSQLELRVARWAQQRYGQKPKIFILVVMLSSAAASMWLSNVTAPVLALSVLHPTLERLPSTSRFVRTLLVALAVACNIGGMLAPVSSPQNAVALEALEAAGYSLSFAEWMGVAVPFCLVALLIAWAFLVALMKPDDVHRVPEVPAARPLRLRDKVVLAIFLVACVLWATLALTRDVLGNLGVIGLLVAVVLFGSGLLTAADLKAFRWDLLLLLAGGNVLGLAVHSSGLLHLVSEAAAPWLGGSLWLLTFKILLLVMAVTTFVSHTVAAIILMPLVTALGAEAGEPQILVMAAALACSASMSLPTTSFPNVNSLLAEDSNGQPYLVVKDFIRAGVPLSLAVLVLTSTLGYFLMVLIL